MHSPPTITQAAPFTLLHGKMARGQLLLARTLALVTTYTLLHCNLASGSPAQVNAGNQAGAIPGARQPLRIAVAASFKPTLVQLAESFTLNTGVQVSISAGSTGLLYAQIIQGAPFDIFMAADAARPSMLEEAGLTKPGSRSSYAYGRLVVWVPGKLAGPSTTAQASRQQPLTLMDVKALNFPLAIANPKLAPFGQAAEQAMEQLGFNPPKLIRGANAAQAVSFIATGNVRAGFVPLSHVRQAKIPASQWWLVPATLHQPIDQQLVILNNAPASQAAWLDFLKSDDARNIIKSAGYALPSETSTDEQGLDPAKSVGRAPEYQARGTGHD